MKNFQEKFLIIIFSIVIVSCDECVDCPNVVEPSWILNESLSLGDKIILEGYLTSEDELYLASVYSLFKIKPGDSIPRFSFDYHDWHLYLDNKPVFNDSVLVFGVSDLRGLSFYNLNNLGNVIPENLFISEIEPEFESYADFGLIETHYTKIGAFNDLNQFFTVILNQNLYGCMINYEFDSSPSGINILSTNVFPFGNTGHVSMVDIESYNDRFFVAVNNFNVVVNPDGSFEYLTLPYSVLDFFTFQDKIWAFDNSLTIHYSDDDGASWNTFGQLNNVFSFFPLDDRLVLVNNSRIWELDIDENTVKELENTGLDGNLITSVTQINNNIHITTLSGLYTTTTQDLY